MIFYVVLCNNCHAYSIRHFYSIAQSMCLWQLAMYQKSTEFFLDPQLKWFSRNKPYKLTQNGAVFEIFKTHYLGSTKYVPMAISHVPKFYRIYFWIQSSIGFPGISHISWPKWPKKVHFSTMCLWQLPMYQKSTEFIFFGSAPQAVFWE